MKMSFIRIINFFLLNNLWIVTLIMSKPGNSNIKSISSANNKLLLCSVMIDSEKNIEIILVPELPKNILPGRL